jgi:hypothetical protein
MHTRVFWLAASSFAVVLASCVGARPPAGTTIGQSTEGQPLPDLPPRTGGPPSPWAEMSRDDRRTYMADHVVPTMGPLFKAFDPERYDDFGCATCHGPVSRLQAYQMPNPSLPVLPVPESPAWNEMMTTRHHVFSFMAERVEIAMAEALGVAPYDPATQQGFGCFNCHTMAAQ